jgi:hypothetical protein
MVSMPFMSALQTTPVTTIKATTIVQQPTTASTSTGYTAQLITLLQKTELNNLDPESTVQMVVLLQKLKLTSPDPAFKMLCQQAITLLSNDWDSTLCDLTLIILIIYAAMQTGWSIKALLQLDLITFGELLVFYPGIYGAFVQWKGVCMPEDSENTQFGTLLYTMSTSPNTCSLCGDATGSATPMPSN